MSVAEFGVDNCIQPVRCDESGLCEIADQLADSGHAAPDRVLDVRREWAIAVDIAPIVVGHVLAFPLTHALRAAELGVDGFGKYWHYVSEFSSELAPLGQGDAVLVEHGSSSDPAARSCVRHCHTHLSPIGSQFRRFSDILSIVAEYVAVSAVMREWEELYDLLADMDEYMLVSWRGRTIVGKPRAGVRQISRVLLARLGNQPQLLDVDWVLQAENQNYRETIAFFKESGSCDVG